MKLARLYAKRRGNGGNAIVCLRGSFHGRTLETVAATMQERLQEDFRPLPQGFVACSLNNVEELRSIFEELGNEICAVCLNPSRAKAACTRYRRSSCAWPPTWFIRREVCSLPMSMSSLRGLEAF